MDIRRFRLALPDDGGRPRPRLTFEVDASLTVPAQLHRRGLAEYEPETVATFLAALEILEPELVLDVGANVGLFALLAGAMSNAHVIGFEPESHLMETARNLAEANHLDNVEFLQLALSDRDGTATFYLSSKGDSSHSLVEGFRVPTGQIEVPTQTLDQVSKSRIPGLIKIDVETAEPMVLAGGVETISKERPWLIIEVLERRTDQAIEEFFADRSYVWYQITNENPLKPRAEVFGDRAGVFRNWLFAPEEPSDRFWELRAGYQRKLRGCVPDAEPSMRTPIQLSGPVVATPSGPAWSPTWNPVPTGAFVATPREDGSFDFRLTKSGYSRWYLSHGDTTFESPPADGDLWALAPLTEYELRWQQSVREGDLEIAIAVIQYSKSSRLRTSWSSEQGDRRIRFVTDPDTSMMRLAIRITGQGEGTLGPFELDRLD